ncbi:hypothetical protein [Chryseobacterium sp.]|uniref:hypothetical protein n=1 Tax=Chryseobacterium sp. TaxID=1871047 RepID=UPI00289F5639|nr:hypothetical protein [Chryseobacterium sp.]
MLKKLAPLLFIFSSFINFNAQDKAEQALETFAQKYPQEKIHLTFNKSSYLSGENLWFKSFVFEGFSPTTISTSLFVELYDSNKTQISKKLVPLINGEGSGDFSLSESLKEGIYYIRAYTTWMTNFSEDFQALQPITVYNSSSPNKLTIDNSSRWKASIFPESGTFIDGINTKFAVRIQSNGEIGNTWNGYVIDVKNPDVKITSFKGYDENVGTFSLSPKSDIQYQLIIDDSKGNKQTVDLPAVSESGVHLQVNSSSNAIKFSLPSKNINTETVYKVIGTINSQLVFKVNSLKDKTYSIPTDKLVNGILQLTVFDDKENIVSQRLCFVQPELLKTKKLNLQSASFNTSPRGFNSFNLPQNAEESAYTVLVLDDKSTSSEDDNSLLSTLWLTGDIHSGIQHPAQYFSKNHNSDALDALLISEKWKRFDWRTIMNGTFPIIRNKPESYISYKGKVSIQGVPAPNTDLNLIFDTPNSGTRLYQVKTDSKGFFTLSGLMFEDSIKFSYQLNEQQKVPKEQVQVIFQPNYSFVPYRGSLPASSYTLTPRLADEKPTPTLERYIATKNTQNTINEKATLIEEIKLKGQRKDKTKKLNNELSSPLFRSGNEVVFDLVNDNNSAAGSSNILQWLQGRVAGLTLEFNMGNYIPKFRGSTIDIFLNEMRVDPSQISSLSTTEIAMVKVIRGNFVGSFGGGNGAIAIYTKRGGTTGSVSDPYAPTKLKQITLTGFDKEDPFITPQYDSESFKTIAQDLRSVLYWNPYLQTQPKEPTPVSFFNNDDSKKYKVIIMGYDKDSDLPVYYYESMP